ncbi:MAG TPA: ribosomal protein S18-alanine N-acetyltransferase [Anaerolineae bacterium]|nr:ribosomal protein S18-alanine N-acetyltransferase [Anaerolineae bacterium]
MLTPPAPFALRPLTLADQDAVMPIDARSFPTTWSAKGYHHELTNNDLAAYQALTYNDTLIGYAGYWLIAAEQHISTIAIDPPWRGRQLGELLFLNMLHLAYTHPATLSTLEVRQYNTTAQALYHKYRFQLVGQRPRYYHDTGEDAFLMTVDPLDTHYKSFLNQQWQTLHQHLTTLQNPPPSPA